MTRSASLILPADEPDMPVDFSLEAYVNARIIGCTPKQAALRAGYRSNRDYLKFERDPYVIERLTKHIAENRREALYTKDKVMEVIERAIDICEIQADGVGMIRGAQEFNKMQGHYAPEKREITLDVDVTVRQKQIQEMSEAELLEALEKETPYIDAEFEEFSEDNG